MINGSKVLDHSIRWAMVGGGKGSQIGYIHRSAAQRDNNFKLVAGAFDINPERGIEFGKELGVEPDRCYPDYQTMFAEEQKREDTSRPSPSRLPTAHITRSRRQPWRQVSTSSVRSRSASPARRPRSCARSRRKRTWSSA